MAGLAVSFYLTAAHYSNAPLACAQTAVVNCDLVTRSAYGLVPGTAIPVSAAGIVWFAVSLALALSVEQSPPRVAVLYVVWSLCGLATVFYLVYAELRLGHLCEWCTIAHALVVLTLLLSVARLSESSQ